MRGADSPADYFAGIDSIETELQKFLFTGDDRNIVEVFTAGTERRAGLDSFLDSHPRATV